MHLGLTGPIRKFPTSQRGSPLITRGELHFTSLLEAGQVAPVGLSDPLRIEFVNFGVVRRQHMLALLGNSTQTCHYVLQVDVVAEGHLLLDIDGDDVGSVASDDGGSRGNLNVDHLVRWCMPPGYDGTDAGEQLALSIKQLDPIPELTDQLADVQAIVEGNWKQRCCCVLQFSPLDKNPCVWQLVIKATMVQMKV